MTDTRNTRTRNTREANRHSAQKETDMPSNKQTDSTTATAQTASDFAALAMSIVAIVPASTVAASDEKIRGNSATKAKQLVDGLDVAKREVTLDDASDWTYTRKAKRGVPNSGQPTAGTWKEAQTAILQAATTTSGDVYVARPTRNNVAITLHRVSLDPMAAARAIIRDVSDVKRLAAKGETDSHRNKLADMGAYLAAAFAAMSDEQRDELKAEYTTA